MNSDRLTEGWYALTDVDKFEMIVELTTELAAMTAERDTANHRAEEAERRIESAYIALRQTLSDYLQHDIDCHRTASLENDCSCWRQAIHRVAAGLDTPHGETGERTIAQILTPDTPSEASDG
jgi:hypothetical protein